MGPLGQSLGVAAQYWLSEQQYQLASGQQPAGHSVSSGPQLVLATFFLRRFFKILGPLGQSLGVAAQYWLSEQQYHPGYGQHPDGHSVSSGPQLVLMTFFFSKFFKILGPFGQSLGVAAQYWLSEQQYQLASGQQPAGHSVSSGPQLVLATFFFKRFFKLLGPFGQSLGVAAQCVLSEQQYHPGYGQHPAGHSVSSGPQPALATFFLKRFFKIIGPFGQSLGVAAQYWLSEQQYQLASGQHPAGHSVSSGPQLVLVTLKRRLGEAEAATAKKANAMKTFILLIK